MQNELNVWKSISLLFFIAVIGLGYLLYQKNSQPEFLPVTSLELPPVDYSENFKTDNVPDGENLYNIGSVLRIDGLSVDDQYFAVLFPVGVNTGLSLEIANDAKVKIFKGFDVPRGELFLVNFDTFRKLTRNLSGDLRSDDVTYKITIKNNLIENIEQVK